MAPGPRALARIETTEQIKEIARRQLAADGPDLSLRGIARELGMVSSAVYRYFASRDDLLTALIIDAYDDMGEAVESAEADVPRGNLAQRWSAVWRSTRLWAQQRPAEYALIYGSPIPGYAAPQDTVASAQRTLLVAAAILRDAVDRGLEPPADRLARAVRTDLVGVAGYPGMEGIPPTLLARALTMWALLFGTLSFELFGRYTNAIIDLDAYFESQLKVSLRYLGLS